MKEKTKKSGWVPLGIAVAITVLVLLVAHLFEWRRLTVTPWHSALGVSTMLSIQEFQDGVTGQLPYWSERLNALGGIILIFVLGPSLWLAAEIQDSNESTHADGTTGKRVGWYAGLVVMLFGIILSVFSIIGNINKYYTLKDGVVSSRSKDEIRMRVTRMANEALRLSMLPHERGGGNGTFTRVRSSDLFRPVKLTDLPSYQGDSGSQYDYVLHEVKPDTLTIVGVGHLEGVDPDFKNVNGKNGRIQIAVQVTPEGSFVHNLNSPDLNN